ncbi:xanthine dehydrogenase family protein molybdopterin-binding subunit [Nostoc sp. UCD121]|uniref:xanthine dehydrogenase family protein molybdopterin-binding subunit n=1 Tax=unclassified Nostoc TaxID=2593658 RepID=UPI0016269FD4|nr:MULTISPECIES: xanthine dehydrogenase family protein molybdopterin-binding subunit [unclassified Nostoc]MBC1221366.1 xanthine dehydrogenase family protein molybdopterin-binding subunit [Nostoc sp. UCD120]MBC1277313.1 xanthine dehydrogenase family protein molybdopterin-binding subunit [Nostoc sp. UCD121]MBC1296327.1 xanthine dehydrogenase family protein molybdopterin-binding subunit [Nostoc sp. UCD122]
MNAGDANIVVGKPLNRVDGHLKVTGEARYAAEFPIAKMTYGVTIQSAIAKGKIAQIDTKAAEQVPGVLAVITHLNAAKADGEKGGGRKLQVLQDNVVLYSGQHIGVVVADTFERAMYAASLVQVRYEQEKPSISMEDNLVKAYLPKTKLPRGDDPDSSYGNVNQGLATAAVRVEQTYTTPVENHNPMEPHATTAVWQGDQVLLYDATQGIFQAQQKVAGVLGIEPEKVRIISYFVGGGFGCKGAAWSHVPLAAIAARHVNRPVKLVLGRTQMYGPVGFRPETIQQISLGATRDGKLTALRHTGISQTSSFDEYIEPVAKSARMIYTSPNIETSHRLVPLDQGTPTYMRAPGEAPGSFALESAMDELAYALDIDPVELRLRNHADSDLTKGLPWSSKSLIQCYKIGAEKFGWQKRNPKPRSMRDGNYLIGWGMATATYPTNRSPASAIAQIMADGTAVVQSGSQDIGTGTYTVMTQVAADALGLPFEKVRFELGDTKMPQTPVSGGSQTAASVSSAVHLAGNEARSKLLKLALADEKSPLYSSNAEDVIAQNGSFFLKNKSSVSETYQAILARHGMKTIEARGDAKLTDAEDKFSMHAFGSQFAEVRVNPDSGEVRVTRWVGSFGVGRILNAKTANSQLIGGIVYGIGMALMEHTIIDPNLGRVVNHDLAEYHVPVNADVPDIEVLFVDEHDPHINPLGVKGIGEIGITGTAAAIANAVYHATGKRVRDLPITLDKLL